MIYLDHNATNLPDPRVVEVYRHALDHGWANPSSLHTPGRRARALIETAREHVAALAGVDPGHVTFCASGTEALNQALHSAAPHGRRSRVVTSAVEHPAVRECLDQLALADRVDPVLAPVTSTALLDLAALPPLLTPDTALLVVLAAQNEVGTLQPLPELGQLAREAHVPLLVDATQAAGRLPWSWPDLPWDLLVVSGHKLRAPRGAAALIHRPEHLAPAPLVLGGGQELGRRAGTEDVPAIAALGEACRLAQLGELQDAQALQDLRQRFEDLLLDLLPHATILAQHAPRLPQTTAILLPGADHEALLAALDLDGICASAGSACSSGAVQTPYVLHAMGVSPERSRGRLRLSFGPETSWDDLERTAHTLRRLAPPPGDC